MANWGAMGRYSWNTSIPLMPLDVRFTPESRYRRAPALFPLCAKSGHHVQRSPVQQSPVYCAFLPVRTSARFASLS